MTSVFWGASSPEPTGPTGLALKRQAWLATVGPSPFSWWNTRSFDVPPVSLQTNSFGFWNARAWVCHKTGNSHPHKIAKSGFRLVSPRKQKEERGGPPNNDALWGQSKASLRSRGRAEAGANQAVGARVDGHLTAVPFHNP